MRAVGGLGRGAVHPTSRPPWLLRQGGECVVPKAASPEARRKRQAKRKVASQCGALKRDGTPCTRPKGWGTQHPGTGRCKNHAGSTHSGQLAAAREQAKGLGLPVPSTPAQGIQATLNIAMGQLAYATQQVNGLEPGELWADTMVGKVPSHWVKLQHELMDKVARFSQVAAGMGIDERRTALAEAQTSMLQTVITAVLDDLGLSPAQRKLAGPAIRKRLEAVQGTVREVSA